MSCNCPENVYTSADLCQACREVHDECMDEYYRDELNRELQAQEDEDDYYDDSMDGDHDSAMRDAGWGTDEDYGYYGGDEYDY